MKTENIEELKVLIPYTRVSSARQAEEDKTGLERQLASARRTLAAHPGWILDEKFNLIDAGLSGYKGKNLDPEADF
jgi:predicted site-specific integrase-resolvase